MVAGKKEISGESYKFIAAYKMVKIFADHTPGLELISKLLLLISKISNM